MIILLKNIWIIIINICLKYKTSISNIIQKQLYEDVKKYADKFILISHLRGYMFANVFGNIYHKEVSGHINIDGEKSKEGFIGYIDVNRIKYDDITNVQLLEYFTTLKNADQLNRKKINRELSNIVQYNQFKQYKKHSLTLNIQHT